MQNLVIGLVFMATMLSGQTRVVNIATDSCDVYIGRGIDRYVHLLTEGISPGTEGWLGNPHPIGWCKICNEAHTRAECIKKFEHDFYKKIESDANFRKVLLGLKGKRLGCYCKPKACHGDIIKAWLDGQE